MSAVRDTFKPLRDRNLSLYLGGQTISLIGTMMQGTAQSWVVWQLTSSSKALGIVAMLGSLPLLIFGAAGGVLADRLNRRRALIGTQVVAMLLAFLFAFLLQSHMLQLWHVYLLSFALGCVSTLDFPMQSAFLGDLVGVTNLRSATIIDQMIMQVARMAGPALAGWVMGALGVTPTFWINGASFLAVIGSLLVVRSRQAQKPAEGRDGDMKEGFRFVGASPRIQDLLLFTLTLTFFAFTTSQLMPAIVSDSLHAGPDALGWIMGASGLGALVGSILVVPALQRVRRVGWVLSGVTVWTGLFMLAVAYAPSVWLAVAAMFLASLTAPVIMTNATSLMQMLAPEEMRGRMMAIWMMVSFGTMPFASLLVGYTGEWLGAPGAITLNGGMMVLIGLGLLLRPGLARWEPVPMRTSGN